MRQTVLGIANYSLNSLRGVIVDSIGEIREVL